MLSEKTTRIGFSPSSYRKAQLIKGSIGIKGKKKSSHLHYTSPCRTTRNTDLQLRPSKQKQRELRKLNQNSSPLLIKPVCCPRAL